MFRIALGTAGGEDMDWEKYSFIGYPLSQTVDGLSVGTLETWHQVSWIAHVVAFVLFLVILPGTMLRHMFTSPLNMYLRDKDRPKGAMKPMPNLMETELEDEQLDFVETIHRSGEALLTIINDILDFSKIEAGKIDLEQERFSVVDCIEEAAELLAAKVAIPMHYDTFDVIAADPQEFVSGVVAAGGAAAVVPPGDRTRAIRESMVSPDCSAISPAPRAVSRTSVSASS